MPIVDKDDRKLLADAEALAGWSFVGLLIPLLGLILASIAKSKLRALPDDISGKDAERYHRAHGNAGVAQFLSGLVVIIILFIWITTYGTNQ